MGDNAGRYARVAVADATPWYDKLYTYKVPALMEGHIFVGSLVLVPFGAGRARPRVGVVAGLEGTAGASDSRLKEILDHAPEDARLTDELLAIVAYLREATFCTWFEAVRAVLPRGAQYRPAKGPGGWVLKKQMDRYTETVYHYAGGLEEGAAGECGEAPSSGGDGPAPEGAGGTAGGDGMGARARAAARPRPLTEKQRLTLAFVREAPRTAAEISAGCGVGPGVAQTLVKRGFLSAGRQDKAAPAPAGFVERAGPQGGLYTLSARQAGVAAGLWQMAQKPQPGTALLYGVTGSGKTAVFLHLIEKTLQRGKTALVLVPEIGLTPQMVGRLQAAFGGRVAVQHSGLSATERLLQWRGIQRGEAAVVVGTRSAVFAPLDNIGLIVIDEEQERTYHSETAPRYDAAEVARRRAARHGALLLLASATPSVASYHAAKTGRCALFTLQERYGRLPLPAVEMVDMRGELLAGNAGALSRALANALEETVAAGRQAIVLLNRRGYHRVALCRDCGKAVKCGECSVPMVYHRAPGRGGPLPDGGEPAGAVPPGHGVLQCHYCGRVQSPAPAACPECGGALRYAGFGTQRLEDELAERLPKARILRMDTDTTSRKGAHASMLARFAAGQYDILLGTQMVAKGLDFERVGLVGVVGIDSLLMSQSYRAYENVFALVTQVVGRSGRARAGLPAGGGAAGMAMIQTVDPENPVLALAARQSYEDFYGQEIAFRRMALYPPFCTLCMVGFAADEEAAALAAARRFAALLSTRAAARADIPLRVLGPAPMPVMQVAGSFRYRLTLKCRADAAFRALVRQVLDDYNKEGLPKTAAVWLDFNPEQ